MSDRTLVNVKVAEEKKERWDRRVENSDEYSTLSHLIRLAVSRELSGEYETTGGGDVDVELDGVDERLGEIQQTVDDIALRMDTLEAEALSGEDVLEIADDMYDLIPTIERARGGVNTESLVTDARMGADVDLNALDEADDEVLEELLDSGIVAVYREYLSVSEYAAGKAAEKLADEYPGVHYESEMGFDVVYEVVRS